MVTNHKEASIYLLLPPFSVLLFDISKIVIFRYPIKLFLPFLFLYIFFISVILCLFLCMHIFLKKAMKIQIFAIWPVIFTVFLRLSVCHVRPFLINALLPILSGICLSILIIFLSNFRKIPKHNYLLYNIFFILIILISIQSKTVIFLLILWLPLLLLSWNKKFSVSLISFLFLLHSRSSYPERYDPKTASDIKFKKNVILIMIDTARKDTIDLKTEYTITPNLKKFAEEGIVINKFVTNGAWTPPTHASIFTGLIPSNHGVYHVDNIQGYSILSDEINTLAEILKQNNINTGGFTANSVLSEEFGFAQGFNQYEYIPPKSPNSLLVIHFVETNLKRIIQYLPSSFDKYRFIANDYKNNVALSDIVLERAQKWIKKNGTDHNFFLFINLMEQHYIRYFFDPVSKKFNIGPKDYYEDKEQLYLKPDTMKKRNEELLAWHKNTIRNVDFYLGKFFNLLKGMGVYNQTTIIITSDHGELFGEKGHYGHQDSIYSQNTFVPFMIKYSKPDLKRKISTSRIYQQVDIFAEILDLFNIPSPPFTYGKPFQPKEGNPIITQLFPLKDIPASLKNLLDVELCGTILNIGGTDYHLIYSSNNKHELYEIKNFFATVDYNSFSHFKDNSKVLNFIQACPELLQKRQSKNKPIYDKKTLERLKSLGYIK